jgi:hypothetical protein
LIDPDGAVLRVHVNRLKPAYLRNQPEGVPSTDDRLSESREEPTYLVWAKVVGHPWLPALTIPEGQLPHVLARKAHKHGDVPVRFFGDDMVAWLPTTLSKIIRKTGISMPIRHSKA